MRPSCYETVVPAPRSRKRSLLANGIACVHSTIHQPGSARVFQSRHEAHWRHHELGIVLYHFPLSKCRPPRDSPHVPGARVISTLPSVRCCDATAVRGDGTLVCFQSLIVAKFPSSWLRFSRAVVCHNPVITVAEYKAMYEAEMNKKAQPKEVRFSNWRCSLCPIPSWNQSTVVGPLSCNITVWVYLNFILC